jgi:hypothetical protein
MGGVRWIVRWQRGVYTRDTNLQCLLNPFLPFPWEGIPLSQAFFFFIIVMDASNGDSVLSVGIYMYIADYQM